MTLYTWPHEKTLRSRHYTCGYCDNPLASEKGWEAKASTGRTRPPASIYICHHCSGPTFFQSGNKQTPAPTFGSPVDNISDDSVKKLYEEARHCTGAGAYTAAVLCCRKLLMHIAVSKGAKPRSSFAYYVDYMAQQSYVPPDATAWVDEIRTKANEANHEIVIVDADSAKDILAFVEVLLKIIYEFPAKTTKPKRGKA